MSNTVSTNTTPNRTIGPVTTASAGGVAVSVIIAWLVQTIFNIGIPSEVQGSIAVVLVIIAGYLVKPRVITLPAQNPSPESGVDPAAGIGIDPAPRHSA
jgi:hypothetical protein